jgi:hypothetical protein
MRRELVRVADLITVVRDPPIDFTLKAFLEEPVVGAGFLLGIDLDA